MQFIKKLFKFDADATTAQKVLTVAAAVVAAVVIIWLFGSCLQLFTNDVSRAAGTATSGQHVLGFILFAAAVVWAWLNWTDRVPFRINETAATVLLGLLLVFSFLFFTGFYARVY